MAQGAGLVLAGQALEQKAAVRVLLCDAAGDIALTGQEGAKAQPTLKPEARRDIWCKFVEIFIHFSICTLCKGIASAAKATGLTEVGIVFSAVR